MPYLNLDVDYFDHRKTLRLTALLGDEAAVYPLRLWAYAGKHHAEDGYLPGYNAVEIENLVRWKGEKGLLVGALIQLKFIKKYSTDFKINDWIDHEGHLAAFKERAVKAARTRWDKIAGRSNATSNAQASPKQSPYLAVPTIPTKPILPNQAEHQGEGVAGAGKMSEEDALIQELAKVGYAKPDPKEDPEKALACAYREIRKIPKHTWVTWDIQNLDEFRPYLRTIIENTGSLSRAYDCMASIIDHFEQEGFKHWTIRGVAKKSFDWVADHPVNERRTVPRPRPSLQIEDPNPMTAEEMEEIKGQNLRRPHGSVDSQGIPLPNAGLKAERSFDTFRSAASPSPNASGIRSLPDVSNGAKPDNGRAAPGDAEGSK